ncbi:MAG: hypothetical protein ACRELS_02870 [Candidatus Rokuibacteriota bacterium]
MTASSPRLRPWVALLAALAVWPCEAPAQGRQESETLGMEQRRKTQVIRPLPPAAEIEQDADQAIEEQRAERRRDELIRQSLPQIKPPYADADVRGGIQSQNILKSLPRR